RHLPVAVRRHPREAPAGLSLDAGALHLRLHLGHAGLQLLGLLHHAGKILHGSVPSSLNSASAPSSISAGWAGGSSLAVARTAAIRAPGKCCSTCLTSG